MKFRKKPVVIEAIQFNHPHDWQKMCDAWPGFAHKSHWACPMPIQTLEGTRHALLGDWIIKGIKGEFYPCKPDIFEATYEAAE